MTVDIPQAATLQPVVIYLTSAISEGCPSRPAYETDEPKTGKTVDEINYLSSSNLILCDIRLCHGYIILITYHTDSNGWKRDGNHEVLCPAVMKTKL